MPGFWLPFGGARWHVNWSLPDISGAHIVVLSSFTSLTGQWLMRGALHGKRWLFWGERLRQKSGIKELMQRGLAMPLAHASGIVGIGRAAEEDYRRRFPNIPHFNIPYYCDLSSFFSVRRYPKTAGPVRFLFCGQMIERKGVDILLLAFNRLISKGVDAELLLVGREAGLRKFLTMVSPTTRSRIRYVGFQAPERLPGFFEQSDVFVLPSRHDGWGVVINQALAAGLPIITSNAVGAGLDLVKNGINGLRVATNDVDSLYRSMETLASNPDVARQWGEGSRKEARDLTPEAGAEKWAQVFDSLRASVG
jgi:glycosyltransferase involved in cell wall biosynthesis